MKKTRIMASLLCLMMVVCALPMMQVSAAVTVPVAELAMPALAPANLGEAVAGVMNAINGNENFKSAGPLNSLNNWANCNLDFTAPNIGSNPYFFFGNGGNGITFNENGANFPATEAVIRYFPGAANIYTAKDVWCPAGESGYFAYGFKLANDGKLTTWSAASNAYNAAWIDATPDGITIYSASAGGSGTNDESKVTYANNYEPGTVWNDVLVKMGGATKPYAVYMKKATDTAFTLVATAEFPANVGHVNVGINSDEYTAKNKGLTYIGTNANVGYAMSIKGSATPVYDSIEEIVGGIVASSYAFDFDSEYDGTFRRDGWTEYTEGVTFSNDNGMTLPANEDGTANTWHYISHNGKWSPFSQGSASAAFNPQSVYLKVKGVLNIKLRAKGSSDRIVNLDFAANSGMMSDGSDGFSTEFAYQDEWVEYLVVPKTTTDTAGYTLYAKGAKSTGNVWKQIYSSNGYVLGGGEYTGITITGLGGSVKAIRTLRPAVTEAATIPAGATFLWFGEEMDAEPTYNNLSDSNFVYGENGLAVCDGNKGQFNAGYASIPVGGYAEFRTRAKNRQDFKFFADGSGVSIGFTKDYYTITGGNGFMTDSNCTWRTWRVSRNQNGYNIYAKTDNDSGWLLIAENASETSTSVDGSYIALYNANKAGWDGQFDYFRIYGPAPANALTVTDGYGTKVLRDGDSLGYGSSFRPIITGVESGKLILASYKGQKLERVQIKNVEDLTDKSFFGVSGPGYDTVKAFLWDDFNNLNRLDAALTVVIPTVQ